MIKSVAVQISVSSPEEGGLSDLELVKTILAGEQSSYSVILKKYQDTIYRMLLRQTGDTGIASDLAQETFIRVYEKLGSFRGDSALSTWITRIALNLANNYFSSKDYKERKRNVGPVSPDQTLQADEILADEKKLALLREFIGELKPKQRSVLLLCGLERKSYEEAAVILKIPVGTVRSRLHDARLTIRNRFLTEASDL